MPRLAGIDDLVTNGRFHEFRMEDPSQSQRILEQLTRQRTVTHFEIMKPSLHDIFVRIAKPADTESAMAS